MVASLPTLRNNKELRPFGGFVALFPPRAPAFSRLKRELPAPLECATTSADAGEESPVGLKDRAKLEAAAACVRYKAGSKTPLCTVTAAGRPVGRPPRYLLSPSDLYNSNPLEDSLILNEETIEHLAQSKSVKEPEKLGRYMVLERRHGPSVGGGPEEEGRRGRRERGSELRP